MRLVFAGTPAAALPSLRALLDSRHEVVAVVTRPDAPAGRGRALRASPVAELARAAGVDVLTPARPGEPEFLARLAELAPDCCPVVAYGGLVPPAALAVPRHGWVNLHFSLLPAWRGAARCSARSSPATTSPAPAPSGSRRGSTPVPSTACSPRRSARTTRRAACWSASPRRGRGCSPPPSTGSPTARSSPGRRRPTACPGPRSSPRTTSGSTGPRPRCASTASSARARRRPGAWTTFRGRRLKLGPVRPLPASGGGPGGASGAPDPGPLGPGELRDLGRAGIAVGTGTDPVLLGSVRAEGKPEMAADAWARGARPGPDDRFE